MTKSKSPGRHRAGKITGHKTSMELCVNAYIRNAAEFVQSHADYRELARRRRIFKATHIARMLLVDRGLLIKIGKANYPVENPVKIFIKACHEGFAEDREPRDGWFMTRMALKIAAWQRSSKVPVLSYGAWQIVKGIAAKRPYQASVKEQAPNQGL